MTLNRNWREGGFIESMDNHDRFPSTLSLFGVYLMLEGLQQRAVGLPDLIKREDRKYVLLEKDMLLTEARHLLYTVRTMALHQPDNFDDLIKSIIDFEDVVDAAIGELPCEPSFGNMTLAEAKAKYG